MPDDSQTTQLLFERGESEKREDRTSEGGERLSSFSTLALNRRQEVNWKEHALLEQSA